VLVAVRYAGQDGTVFRLDLHTRWPLVQSDYTGCCINTIVLLRVSTQSLEHVEDSNKHIIEEIVRQVGYLPELYEDARSEKHKKTL
jgi:hypothetical protein